MIIFLFFAITVKQLTKNSDCARGRAVRAILKEKLGDVHIKRQVLVQHIDEHGKILDNGDQTIYIRLLLKKKKKKNSTYV